MGVELSLDINPTGQEEFHALDKRVMRHAFDIHNTLGRFLDERIYQEELAQRCREEGFDARREVHVRIDHKSFAKSYYLDLLLNSGVIYELKAVEELSGGHERQLIHYLLLTDLHHGKLINFRSGSVKTRFVSTSLTKGDRTDFVIQRDGWHPADDLSRLLPRTLHDLLADWGAFLEVSLYQEALLALLRGPGTGLKPVEIGSGGRVLGTQKMCLLSPDTAWHISAIRRHFGTYETHIRRLLSHAALRRIHWINFDHRTITLRTITNEK